MAGAMGYEEKGGAVQTLLVEEVAHGFVQFSGGCVVFLLDPFDQVFGGLPEDCVDDGRPAAGYGEEDVTKGRDAGDEGLHGLFFRCRWSGGRDQSGVCERLTHCDRGVDRLRRDP